MCVLAQGIACLHLSTWRSLHVSPAPTYHVCLKRWSENSKPSQAGALRGWVWSARAWRPRTAGCRMVYLWTRKGAGNRRREHKGRGESCGLLMWSGASGAAVLEPKHRDPQAPSQQAARAARHGPLGPLLWMPSIFSLYESNIHAEENGNGPWGTCYSGFHLNRVEKYLCGHCKHCQHPRCANSTGKQRAWVSISLKLASFTSIKTLF